MTFARPTLSQLIDRSKSDISSRLQTGPLLPRSVLGVLATVHAGALHQLYGYLDYIARQIIVDTADSEYLSRWASIWGIIRNPATYATGNITFTGSVGSVIPSGTRVQRVDGVEFDTTAELTLVSSSGSVAAKAVSAGAASNTDVAVSLSVTSPVSGVDSTAVVAAGGLAGGADEESDDSLRVRLVARIQQPPHGGADFDYVAWAKEITGVTRAWCYPLYLGPGTVGVAIVTDDAVDGPIADSQVVDDVQDHIDALRPVTADVTVFTPVAVEMDPEIVLTPDNATVRAAVTAELKDMLRRDAEPGGTVYLSRIREAISIAAGESNHELVSPTDDVTVSTGELLTLGTITWSS